MRTLKLVDGEGTAYHDRWDSYSRERDELMSHLALGASTPVVLCGDVHFAAFSHAGRESGHGVFECVTTSVTSANFDDKMGWEPGNQSRPYEAALVKSVPDLDWCDLDRHGYMVVEVSESALVCEWWGVDTVRQRSSGVQLLHRVDLEAQP